MKTAVVTGITGQDGAYLAQYLLESGYRVYGAYRRTASTNFWRIEELGVAAHPELHLVDFDLTDPGSCLHLLDRAKPDEVYNLAAQSFVSVSFDQPNATTQITGVGALNLLEAIRVVNPAIRFYQASTSEMFGKVQEIPQDENTPFFPCSPYGVAKLFAHWTTINYSDAYGIFGTSGILFNHESPLRGLEFVTRKITDGIVKIKEGRLDCLELGNLEAQRDWGFAGDYVRGMHLMLQADNPGAYVLATGRTETVREFINITCQCVDIGIEWRGSGVDEVGVDVATGKEIVRINPRFHRPKEVDLLIGDASRAREVLGWEPVTTLEELCAMMVAAEFRRLDNGFSF